MKFTRPALPFSHPACWLGTWFGSGLLPKAPGTCGTLAALPFAWIIGYYEGKNGLLLASLLAFLLGWAASARYVLALSEKDPKEIVIDEVAGVWLTLAFLPLSLGGFALGFALFRFFDIVKPWPVSWCDRKIKGGLGVMVDDVAAAGYGIFLILCYKFCNL